MEKDKLVDVLQELLEFVNDGHAGYLHAAKEDKHQEHKDFYNRLAQQRKSFSEELNQFVRNAGGDPETGTTTKGKFYRQFMDIKAAITGSNDKSIINSCLFGEEWAQKAYEEALSSHDLPANVRQTLERQREASRDAMRKLEEMKGK